MGFRLSDAAPDRSPGRIYIGPAGWAYNDWKGIVYPPNMPKGQHPLTVLSRYFKTVEVNASFYRPPDPRWGPAWLGKVNAQPDFRFTYKLWQRFTHERDTWPGAAERQRVVDGMAAVYEAGKLGALLVQFPWSFKRTESNRRWLLQVVEAFGVYPLVVEMRHASWNRPEVFEGLGQRGIAFCNIDQPLFRASLGPTEAATAPVGYIRLHGRNVGDWFREDAGRDERYDYLYSAEELMPWLQKIERLRERVQELYVITNNHFRGQAVVNALELMHGAGMAIPELPECLTAAYPRLQALVT